MIHIGNVPEGGQFITTLQDPDDLSRWDVYQTRNKNPIEFVTLKLVAQEHAPIKANYRVYYNMQQKRFSRTTDWLSLIRQRNPLHLELFAFCGQEWGV